MEYLPCVVAGECKNLMQEFMQGFMGDTTEATNHLKSREGELYEPADTMKQYLEHYQNIRRASSMQSQSQMGQPQHQQQQPQQQQMAQMSHQQHQQHQQQQQQIPIPVGINQMAMGHR